VERIGTVESICRYPVKSMSGEDVAQAFVGFAGLMARQKLPEISSIFKPDTARLHVSREKDGKLHLVDAGWGDAKAVQPDGCGQARTGVEGWILPPAGGTMTPLQKLGPPLRPPWFFQL
jgi:hypothetical protein